MKDLLLLVPDKNTQFALRGGLPRSDALGIRDITFHIVVHPGRDGGVRRTGVELIALEKHQFSHAMMVLDFEGSGTSRHRAIELEQDLDEKLRSAWGPNAKAIVVDPEVDIWMWGSDNALREIIGWSSPAGIRTWLENEQFAFGDHEKPLRPKEALDRLLRECGRPRSSALYETISSRISLTRCTDSAFRRLHAQLQQWYGSNPTP